MPDVSYGPIHPGHPRQAFPLQEYAALGDGRTVAIVAPNGAITWWAVPNLDSQPLFDALLDPVAGGVFVLQPTEPFTATRRYHRDSNVLETEFTTSSGTVRLTESLNSTLAGRLPWCELARRVDGVSGTVAMRAELVPGTRAGTISPWLEPNSNGPILHAGPVHCVLRATPNVHIDAEDRSLAARFTVSAGERATLALLANESQPLGIPAIADIDARIDGSDRAWCDWAAALRYGGPYREAVRRSALALKLLLFSPSGAIAAAATTSLPERIGSIRNYDYRFAWVRDAAYTLSAFLRLGVVPESQAALAWLLGRLGETGPKVCYRLDGSPVPPVSLLDLPGYRQSRPVVSGNLAGSQHQHGIFGDIFQAVLYFTEAGNVMDLRSRGVLSDLADDCCDRWQQKDAGMWELRETQHYTMSKVSCWQALQHATTLATAGHLPTACAPRWERERDRIAAWIDAHCWSEELGAYTAYPGTHILDASLALAAPFGFGRDPGRAARLNRTYDAIRRTLSDGPWIYRLTDARDEEGAFLACTFWLAEAYAVMGRAPEGDALMIEALGSLPPGPGILAEMIDPSTGDALGNIPQGLSHLALIHAALALEAASR